jgi:3'(2'), 5'-bisphosphate nucleotidase
MAQDTGARPASFAEVIDFLELTLRAAGKLLLQARRGAIAARQKSDRSPVTAADFAVQALVGRALAQERTSHPRGPWRAPMIGEEDGRDLATPESAEIRAAAVDLLRLAEVEATEEQVRTWVGEQPSGTLAGLPPAYWLIDPIDGTVGYQGHGLYASALAYVEGGVVQAGGLACPTLGDDLNPDSDGQGVVMVGAHGAGVWLSSLSGESRRPVQVSGVDSPRRARVLISNVSAHADPGRLEACLARLDPLSPPRRLDSLAKYALLAGGRADLILRLPRDRSAEKIWDFAAGVFLVEEAGGRVTDGHGASLRFDVGLELPDAPDIVASNGALHSHALVALHDGPPAHP